MAQTRKAKRKSRGESLLIRYLVLGSWATVCLAPILWFLTIAFRSRTEIISTSPIGHCSHS